MCDDSGSLSNIINFGGNSHTTNLKYFLEQHFKATALYKQPFIVIKSLKNFRRSNDEVIITVLLSNKKTGEIIIKNNNKKQFKIDLTPDNTRFMYIFYDNIILSNDPSNINYTKKHINDKWNVLYLNDEWDTYNRYINLNINVLKNLGLENIARWKPNDDYSIKYTINGEEVIISNDENSFE